MYQKYYTEALVLGSWEKGESDRTFALYTRDFGLVHARARAVRMARSRMRYALQHYSRTQVALVRGRGGWRIGGAISDGSHGKNLEDVSIFARIARLVMRLVAGEEQNRYLFGALAQAHSVLTSHGDKPASVSATIEMVCVARVLYALGYLSAEALGTTLFTHTAYAAEHLFEAEAVRDSLLSSINKAIADTHL